MAKTPPKPITEAVQLRDLKPAQRKVVNSVVGDFTEHLASNMTARAVSLRSQALVSKPSTAKTQRARATRLLAAATVAPSKRLTLGAAAGNRVDAVTDAAVNRRAPGENVPGAGWYFHAHGEVTRAAPGVAPDVAIAASSSLSPGSSPESERASLGALAAAHRGGQVHLSPKLVDHLGRKGLQVPAEMHGKVVPFGALPSEAVSRLVEPKARAMAQAHSSGVDWTGIGRVSSPQNIVKATKILRGETPLGQAQSPTGAPKTWSYTSQQQRSVPGTPEHAEYMQRAAHMGDTMRGEVSGRQEMFDYHGLRGSNEGVLSNAGHTAEDSWMQGISVGIKDPKLVKAGGDVAPGRKTMTDAQGVRVSAHEDPAVKGPALYHAWNNEATHQAAQRIQQQHGLGFTVPSTLVQETAWTGTRRRVGADPEFNAMSRDLKHGETVTSDRVKGQQALFSAKSAGAAPAVKAVPAPRRAPVAEEGVPVGAARMREEAKAGAIGRAISTRARKTRASGYDDEAELAGYRAAGERLLSHGQFGSGG